MQTKLHILLVDDDPIYQLVAKKLISACGFTGAISAVLNGQEALQYLKESIQEHTMEPDIILLDLNMPVMNGWQFLDAFDRFKKAFSKQITIYIITSSADSFDVCKAREYETVKGYVVKPMLKENFEQIVTRL